MPTDDISGTVYIWYPNDGKVGHASMFIGADLNRHSSENYVSWWPQGHGQYFNVLRECNTYTEDQAAEGQPHLMYRLQGGAIEPMKVVWTAIRDKPNSHYDVIKKNCATIVARVMNAGQHHKEIPRSKRGSAAHQLIWSPRAVAQYCDELVRIGTATRVRGRDYPVASEASAFHRIMNMR